jgi:hypothetical protein
MMRHKKTETYAADSRRNGHSVHKNNKVAKSSNNKPSSSIDDRKMDTGGSKKMPRPNLTQLIEQKLFENDQLRRELSLSGKGTVQATVQGYI